MITCLLAYFNDIPVGAVCCRVDHSQNQKRLYIMTLGCLAPYRRLGIGKHLLAPVKRGARLNQCPGFLTLCPLSQQVQKC